jgi:uncharacterized protein YqfA (UPF0365 family)
MIVPDPYSIQFYIWLVTVSVVTLIVIVQLIPEGVWTSGWAAYAMIKDLLRRLRHRATMGSPDERR